MNTYNIGTRVKIHGAKSFAKVCNGAHGTVIAIELRDRMYRVRFDTPVKLEIDGHVVVIKEDLFQFKTVRKHKIG